MTISITTGPGRNWASIWKPLIDAFGPVLGENPERPFHPNDDRITSLDLHHNVNTAIGHDVIIAAWWTSLIAEYEHADDPLPVPGLRQVVVDSEGSPVAVIETTAVRVMRLGDVGLDHALGEGEGYASVAEWRSAHEQFWHSAEMRQALGDPAFTAGDDTLVVASEFRLILD